MQQHADFSFQRLDAVEYPPWLREVPRVAAAHHEYLDGSGYGKGLKGKEIPIESRVITVADIFDAVTSVRAYKPRMPFNEVFAIMNAHTGTKVDAQVVSAFNNLPLARVLGILESAPGRPKLPSLRELQGIKLGDVFKPLHHETPTGAKELRAREIFQQIYDAPNVQPKAKKPPADGGTFTDTNPTPQT
jgi:hypothetical protein